MKATVLSHDDGGTYVMTHDGSFRTYQGLSSIPVGSEIKLSEHGDLQEVKEVKAVNKPSETNETKESNPPTVWHDLGMLGLKIGIIALITVALFSFVYGLHYNLEPGMNPAVKDGDLVLFYRLSKDYVASDLVLVSFQDETQVRRVIAVPGDTVDIKEHGLIVNGALQQEPEIFEETELFTDGPDFPMTLGPNEIFVLGDSRGNAIDSRLYGAVDIEDTLGKVITIIRRRNL